MFIQYKIKDVCSVVVHYKFNKKKLQENLSLHLKNFRTVILVNNSPEINLNFLKSSNLIILNNKKNIGLAAALNKGIKYAEKKKYKMVALFDQDTILRENFNKNMLDNINKLLKRTKKKIALFAPSYFNLITQKYSKNINIETLKLKRNKITKKKQFSFPDYVITSGAYIPIYNLKKIGYMLEKLFIDFIDIEWCLRARMKGFEIVSINNVQLKHRMGDYFLKVFGEKYPIHSPVRMYYYFRNSFYIYIYRNLSLNWKIIDFSRNIFRILFYMIFVNNRLSYMKYIFKGIFHGIISKMNYLKM